jgi:hypothetical protein
MASLNMPREIQTIREKYGSLQVISMVEGTFMRPKMYTIGGTVFEVAAFLEGYYSGVTKSQRSFYATWGDFNTWLVAEIDNRLRDNWHSLYQKIVELYPHDDLAFDYLLDKFLEFQTEQNKTSETD